jgi:poly-gamma-glutamate synthase PgsB/CapB
MPSGFWILLVITALLASLGVMEALTHRRNLARIPVRIHVNGTRGKSSVTRLIAAGLRQGGVKTCAKTTGTLARMIMPDGSEYPVFRPAGANIIEQLRIVRTAATYEPQVLVIECMAVHPLLQSLSELTLIRATHGVITNARADHLDVMGPTEEHVAAALAATTPIGGTLFTSERRHLATFEASAKDRGATMVTIREADVEAIKPEDLAGFSYIEHAENLALALRVCEELGVPREIAIRGMWKARPDPGVMTEHTLSFFGRKLVFVNGFAANDPESTERIWNMALERFPDVEKRIATLNCRADRPDRSRQIGEACVHWPAADHYVLIGTGTYIFARAASEAGIDERKLVFAEDMRIEEIFELLVELAGPSALVMGMANIGGQGLALVRHFKNRSEMIEAA